MNVFYVIKVYTFDHNDAIQYGVDSAILLFHLRYWVSKNQANDKNYRDGMYWTYNSTSAFAKLFPFWTARKIGRILSKLEADGVIVSANYNSKKYDRTKWFTVLDNSIYQNCQMHSTKTVNAYTENVEPIPKNTHTNNQNTTKVVMPFESEEFSSAWLLWRRFKKEQFNFTYKSNISEQAALKDLAQISNQNEETAIKYINNAIAKGWQGIYAIKGKDKRNKNFDGAKYRDYIDTL